MLNMYMFNADLRQVPEYCIKGIQRINKKKKKNRSSHWLRWGISRPQSHAYLPGCVPILSEHCYNIVLI